MASPRLGSQAFAASAGLSVPGQSEAEGTATITVTPDPAAVAAAVALSGPPSSEQLAATASAAHTTTPRISPFFTLVASTSPATNSTTFHHPHVHYVFSDDSTDLTTEASLRALDSLSAHNRTSGSSAITTSETTPSNSHTRAKKSGSGDQSFDGDDGAEGAGGGDEQQKEHSSLLPPKKEGMAERYVILDMDTNGEKVVSVRSMASDWAVTGVEIGAAPTWGGSSGSRGQGKTGGDVGAEEEQDEDLDGQQGVMLKIEGVEFGVETTEAADGDVNELLKAFQRNIEGLRKVVESGNFQKKAG